MTVPGMHRGQGEVEEGVMGCPKEMACDDLGDALQFSNQKGVLYTNEWENLTSSAKTQGELRSSECYKGEALRSGRDVRRCS